MLKSLFFRVFLSYALIIVLLGGAVAVLAPPLMKKHHFEEQSAGLEHLGILLEDRVVPHLLGKGEGDLEAYVSAIGKRTSTRITVINREGQVIADSEKEPRDMENHLYRPEIFKALQGQKQMSIRFSSTLNQNMMYMSLPLRSGDQVVGVLRLSLFMTDLDLLFGRLRADLLRTLGLVAALALLLAFFFTRSTSRPVKEFVDVSSRVASGDLKAKVSVRQRDEFKALAVSFNAMTQELDTLFQETRLQAEELDRILAAIKEGLCILDHDGRIVTCNEGFRNIASTGPAEGKYLWEAIRSSKFAEVIRGVQTSGRAAAEEVNLGDRVYSLSVSPLASGDRFMVILRDITDFRDLERAK